MKGFTLIELLVVIGILGTLSAVLLAAINPIAQLQKSSDARRKADLESVQRALELYYQDTGSYPPSFPGSYTITNNNASADWGKQWLPYMATLPKDPVSPKDTYVYYSQNGQSYYLYAHLQRGANDPDVCNTGSACKTLLDNVGGSFPGANACGEVCNYGVSSPNVSP